jgi:undecaprenyl-diphosphatase
MNSFDSSVITFLNGFARHSSVFDTFVYMISDNSLLKGGVIAALVWWVWFRHGLDRPEVRQFLLCGMIAGLVSVAVARSLAHALPYRERPLRVAALHFQQPYGTSEEELINWSSFPSDHAAIFFALATSIFLAWRPAGIFALCHTFIFICLPRLYLGYHYPSDVLAGAFIGIAIAWLSRFMIVRQKVSRLTTPWLEQSPGSFYACLFLVTFQIATIFESVREIIHFALRFLKPT